MEQFHQEKENTSKTKDLLKVIPFFPSFFLLQLFHTLNQIAMNHSNMPYIFVLVTKAGGINWDIDLSNYAETI